MTSDQTIPELSSVARELADMVERQFTIAEYNYLIAHGWRPCGFYRTHEGVWTKEPLWLPPYGYPSYKGKELGVVTRHAVNSQRKQRRTP